MTTTLDSATSPTQLSTGPSTAVVAAPRRRAVGRGAALVGRAVWKSAAIGLFLLLWEFGPNHLLDGQTRVFLPPLHEDLQAAWRLIQNGQLTSDVKASLTRSVIGFGVAVLTAIPLGLLIGWYRPVESFLDPLLEVFRNTAALALLPVFTLLLGIGETSKIAIVSYASFFPILLNTVLGVKTVDPLLVRAARTLGLSSPRLFLKVILPSAVPTIFTGIRMAATSSILVLIAAEMVGAKAGLGFEIVNAQSSFQIPDMYAAILATSILGVAVNYGFVRLERYFSRWRTGAALAR
jgi:NitT/TauT family transport system permease protein